MPAHPLALELIRRPDSLAGPSANRFSQLSPTTAEHVRAGLGGAVDLILDGGPCRVGIESTVLSLAGGKARLLRPGMVSKSERAADSAGWRLGGDGAAESHPSPGMHPKHYSPRTPLLLVRSGDLPARGRGAYLYRKAARLDRRGYGGGDAGGKPGLRRAAVRDAAQAGRRRTGLDCVGGHRKAPSGRGKGPAGTGIVRVGRVATHDMLASTSLRSAGSSRTVSTPRVRRPSRASYPRASPASDCALRLSAESTGARRRRYRPGGGGSGLATA